MSIFILVSLGVAVIATMLGLVIDSVYRAIVPLPKHRAWRWYHRRW